MLNLAERLGLTVTELMHGRGAPMMSAELAEWQAEELIRAEERLHRKLEAKAKAASRTR